MLPFRYDEGFGVVVHMKGIHIPVRVAVKSINWYNNGKRKDDGEQTIDR